LDRINRNLDRENLFGWIEKTDTLSGAEEDFFNFAVVKPSFGLKNGPRLILN
jgi:hypothetical protein